MMNKWTVKSLYIFWFPAQRYSTTSNVQNMEHVQRINEKQSKINASPLLLGDFFSLVVLNLFF